MKRLLSIRSLSQRVSRKMAVQVVIVVIMLSPALLYGQYVQVTLSLETNRIAVGSNTFLHVYGQIISAYQTNTDRIFSWYVDLINTNGSIAQGDWAKLQRPKSDRDMNTSSAGVTVGANRRGIYDTFINLPSAGRTNPVELFSVPIKGQAPGKTAFRVQAGSGVPNLIADFIVAPKGGGDPLIGGDYRAASQQLEVLGSSAASNVLVSIVSTGLPNSVLKRLTMTFPLVSGRNHTVESRPDLGSGQKWQALPGAPHNSGLVVDTNNAPQRFYRLHVD
jgi:hypothetical protein